MGLLQTIAGGIGNAIENIPGQNKTGSLFGNTAIDISQTLRDFGGSGNFSIVRPAYADNGSVYKTENVANTMYPSPAPKTGGTSGGALIQNNVPLTNPAPQQPQQQSGGGVNQGNLMSLFPGYAGWDPGSAWADYLATGGAGKGGSTGGGINYDALRGEISSGWDNYINQLGELTGFLGQQKEAQLGSAQSQYGAGVSNLGIQKEQGISTAEQNQTKTLRDLASNLRNSFMAGNVFLGARGAGDSSAADQYSQALTKQGSRQRSDIMQQTAGVVKNIQDQYNMGVNQLKSDYDTTVGNIANWFAGKQMELKQAQASGQLSKSQDLQNLSKDILNQAISAMNTAKTQLAEKQSALESWAMSNSQNVQQLAGNLRNAYSMLPQAQQISGTPQVDSQGNFRVPTGYGQSERERSLFGI